MAETHLNDISKVYLDQIAEKNIEELYKGKHGQSEKEYADSRSPGGKMVSGDSKGSGAEYTHGRRVKAANPGMQPDVGGKTKPKSQGKMDAGTRADLQYRKANLKAKNEEFEMDEAMSSYDRNRKRAAQRAAERNAARAAGKTGVVPGVGYVSPRKERETYVDSTGTTRHKSGAKMEEVELDENRRAARAAGGYKDDSKKQTDPSKAGFTGISGSIKDIMRQNKEIEARNKAKSKTESLDPVGKEDGDVNNDGKKDKTDKYLMKRRKAIAASINKKKVKESFSDWRTELSEVIGDTDVKKKSETPKIKEGNVDNASKIKINPEIKEAVEEIGGTLLEMVEVDEMDYILESVYDELIEEGFTEEDVEFGIEQALVQDLEEVTSPAKVSSLKMKKATYTVKPETKEEPKKSFKDRLKSAAKNAIVGASRAVGSMVKKKADAQSGVKKTKNKIGHYVKRAKELARQGYEQGRGPVEKKPTTYRGAGVGRREKIGEDLVNEQDSAPNEKQMLAKKKQMMLKQQLLDKQRLQMQQQGKLPTGHRTEATEDSLRDRRMERGGVDGNVRYDKPAKNIATAKSKSKMSSDDVFKKVKAELIAKHGKGSIIDTKKK